MRSHDLNRLLDEPGPGRRSALTENTAFESDAIRRFAPHGAPQRERYAANPRVLPGSREADILTR